MSFEILFYLISSVLIFWLAYRRALKLRLVQILHSKPIYHGFYVVLSVLLPLFVFSICWSYVSNFYYQSVAFNALPEQITSAPNFDKNVTIGSIQSAVKSLSFKTLSPEIQIASQAWLSAKANLTVYKNILLCILAGILFWRTYNKVEPQFRAKTRVERIIKYILFSCALVAVLTTIGIVLSLTFETLRFFSQYPFWDFITGTKWSPQTAIRADQIGSSGAFGIIPLLAGTLLITIIAIAVAGPIGLFSAIFLAEYASDKLRSKVKPLLEILAGIPTVVFGFFAALTVAPLIRNSGEAFGLDVASESALAAGLVMGFMIIPFISSLSDDVISAVPQALRDGSYALGATQSETIKKVILPAALPGIVSAFMLAISRAIGETMIVVMAAGLIANLTLNPLDAVTTFTVQIKTLLVGDQEFDSVKTLSAFALGFVLFFITLSLNIFALKLVRKYREQYD